jgi:hypothetical protein
LKGRNTGFWLATAIVCLSIASSAGAQSLTYSRGQNVAPAYEGWELGSDGNKYFLFGYMNRNWEEEIDVPVGPENGFNVGGADQGQPTHFLPRRNRFVFRVRVPATFGEKDELVWTLTTHGKTEKAYATLRPDYIVDDVVKASETGALGAGTSSPEVRSNKPPVVRIEEVKARNVKVGEWLPLVAEVKDDGIPKPRDLSRVAAGAGAGRQPGGRGTARPAEEPGDVAADEDHGRQEPGAARVLVRLPRARQGDLRSAAGQGMGGHARGRELAVGAALGRAEIAGGWQAAGQRVFRHARDLRAPLRRRRRRADLGRGRHHHRRALKKSLSCADVRRAPLVRRLCLATVRVKIA